MLRKIILSISFLACINIYAGRCSNFAIEMSKFVLHDESAAEIEWLDFETAIARNKEERKLIFIDVYTGWCGWCKKMDASTFKDADVVEYMSDHFYAVKMDAETNDGIVYNEILYEKKGRYNELAVNLLAGKMTFPSFVILSKREVKLGTIVGFQKPNQLITSLKKYAKDK